MTDAKKPEDDRNDAQHSAHDDDTDDAQDVMDAVRARMLAAALPHVPDVGWEEALKLALAAEDADIGALAFPGGAETLVLHFFAEGDRRMLESLGAMDLSSKRIRDRIRAAVKLRLQVDSPHREAMRRGIAFLALPGHAMAAAGSMYACVDAIWRAIGDRSTDFNFYSKRGILALVMSSTTLFWLNDNSEGQEATWRFLDRRIENVMAFEGVKARARNARNNMCADKGGLLDTLARWRYPN